MEVFSGLCKFLIFISVFLFESFFFFSYSYTWDFLLSHTFTNHCFSPVLLIMFLFSTFSCKQISIPFFTAFINFFNEPFFYKINFVTKNIYLFQWNLNFIHVIHNNWIIPSTLRPTLAYSNLPFTDNRHMKMHKHSWWT